MDCVVRCVVSPSNSAIKIAGKREGAKVEFEAPASEAEKLVKFAQIAFENSFLVWANVDGQQISFWASFPQTNAFRGSGEIIRFRLDISESEIETVLALVLYAREKELTLSFSFEE